MTGPIGFLETEEQLLAKETLYAPTGVTPDDAGTCDLWLPRHHGLHRITEKRERKFSGEPSLAELSDAGYLTPTTLHYVDNKGPVPRLSDKSHTLTLATNNRTRTFNMRQLRRMRAATVPATLVCSANRSKELSMLQATPGPNFGPAAVATSIWTGVPLRVLLRKIGVTKPSEGAQFVLFRGPKGEAPGKGDGMVETCIPIAMALDPASDVIVAYKQNYKPLLPDQGFPLRVVVPGWVCARMVKWLTTITVSQFESENVFHLFDNKILPNMSRMQALKQGAFLNPEYKYDVANLNSAVWSPKHDELVKVTGDEGQRYTVQGYAHSGGGRRVTRVEVSLDGGSQWELANVTCAAPNRHAKFWCWSIWSFAVPISKLVKSASKSIKCRAWDDSNNTQPSHMSWNCLGLGNNAQFTVKINQISLPDGSSVLHFEHPTEPGFKSGGWMGGLVGEYKPPAEEAVAVPVAAAAEVVEAKKAPKAVVASKVDASGKRFISMAEVELHDKEDDVWIVVAGKVYDATKYLPEHPGGADSITINAGTDTTEEFEAIHSKKAWKQLDPWYIGELATDDTEPSSDVTASDAAQSPPAPAPAVVVTGQPDLLPFPAGPIALNAKKRIPFKLISREDVSWNSRIYTYALQSKTHVWGLPVGKHVMCAAKVDDKLVMRAYTPISKNEELGQFRLLIKTYFPDKERGDSGGAMTMHMESMKIGDELEVKGPIGHIQYKGKGYWMNGKEEVFSSKMIMIAGGTGITPMWQLIQGALQVPDDKTVFYVIYANQSWDDILLRDELEDLAKKYPDRLKMWHTLSRSQPAGWKQGTGRITERMFQEFFPKHDQDCAAFLCGPDGMIYDCGVPWLKNMGYTDNRIGIF
mmetsp:Transcript_44397/g.82920  ORF Transcript_44397/g.82920 Transcript_44397/m.82920 type:complete len:866 (-) Transcript_44397:2067-4664(-)|eukprot:CAMPEP_0114287834 /NCGR_PEP_ID=MMETSP0059-20121206/6488_1 /TAXON_ID=36894 /ORGANISM="Pyramimonas parkeae, Strain CCMP726" /LENGTH=865 /DNA_ID=CAMNT_0001408939 /DNA_START=53 /DNA_END=2650 /DNA_ORIENTATION=+